MTDMLGIALGVDTSGLKQGGTELDKFAAKSAGAGNAASKFTGQVGMLNTGLKTVGTVILPSINKQLPVTTTRLQKFMSGLKPAKNATQLLAYQAQDLAVQLSMGTSALVAFGQQSPQAFSAFGPSGAVLGAIAGVGFALAGPLITAFSDAGDAASDFQSKVDEVTSSLKSTRLEIATGAASLLRKQLDESVEEIDRLGIIGRSVASGAVDLSKNPKLAERYTEQQEKLNKALSNQEKRRESLRQIEKEILEIRSGDVGIQTEIPDQDLNSFSYTEYLAEKEAQAEQSRIRQEDGLIRSLAREDALWLRHREKQKRDAEKLEADKKAMRDLELSTTADLFGNLSELAAAGGEESFTMYKRMAQAQAGVSAGLAILNALSAPTGNPILNAGLAVTIGALAGVQIAQIESQTYSGGRAMGGQVSGGNSYMVGEMGPEIITMGAQGGFVTPNHKLGGSENVTVVNQISNGVQGNVRAEIMAAMPAIIGATSKAVRSARR